MRYCPLCGDSSDADQCPKDGTPTVRRVATATGYVTKGEVIGGRYRVSAEIGRGGFGTVYEAQHVTTGHAVAVKLLSQQIGVEGDELARRFFKEAATTSRLSHPNTVRVFDFGQTEGGDLFIAMERLVGESLQELLARNHQQQVVMSLAQTVEIGVAVLRSLAEAHAHGLVHRDLKPANIFLHQVAGGDSIVKVLDFGIVKDIDATITQAGKAIGTPTHMSPEQAMGKEVDARSDLYALGCVLFECLSGSLPYFADSPLAIVMKHVTEAVPSLMERAPGLVQPAVAEVVERALAKAPADRWSDANAMRTALQEALSAPGAGAFPLNIQPLSRQKAAKRPGLDAQSGAENALPGGITQPRSAPPRPTAPRPAPPRTTGVVPSRRPRSPQPPAAIQSAPISSIRIRLPQPGAHSSRASSRSKWSAPSAEEVNTEDRTVVERPAMLDTPAGPVPVLSHGRPLQASPPPADTAPPRDYDGSQHSQADEREQPEMLEMPDVAASPEPAAHMVSGPAVATGVGAILGEEDVIVHAHPDVTRPSPASPDLASARALGGIGARSSYGGREVSSGRPSFPSDATASAEDTADTASRAGEMGHDRNRRVGLDQLAASMARIAGLTAPGGSFGGNRDVNAMRAQLSQNLARMTSEFGRLSGPATRPVAAQQPMIAAVWIAPDGGTVIFGDRDGRVRILHDQQIGEQPVWLLDAANCLTLGEHETMVTALAMSPDGRMLLTAGLGGILKAWSPASGKLLHELDVGAGVNAIGISVDSKLALVGCDDGAARLIELPELTERRRLRGHPDSVTAVAIGGSRRAVVTAGQGGVVRTWDPVGGGARLTARGHHGTVAAVALDRRGKWVISGGWDGKARVWSPRTGETVHVIEAHNDIVAGVALDPTGGFFATVGDDRAARIWDLTDGRLVAERTDFDAGAKYVRFREDGRCIYVADWAGSVRRLSAVASL